MEGDSITRFSATFFIVVISLIHASHANTPPAVLNKAAILAIVVGQFSGNVHPEKTFEPKKKSS